jgi:hypothetical protein
MQRLPKSLESDEVLKAFILKHSAPLFEGSAFAVPSIPLTSDLQKALAFARRCGRLRGGLEGIEVQLQGEAAGLAKTAAKGTPNQAKGSSRILFVTNDGSERFYRNVESLAAKHSPRLFVIQLELDAAGMGGHFFGETAKVKAMLVSEKDFVTRCFHGIQQKL